MVVVGDRRALAQELGHDDEPDASLRWCPIDPERREDDRFGRSRRNGAAQDDEMAARLGGQRPADGFRGLPDCAQIQASIAPAGGAHADDRDVGRQDGGAGVGGRREPPGPIPPPQQSVQTGLDHGGETATEAHDLGRCNVHAEDAMAVLRETGCRHAADVTEAEDADPHAPLLCCSLLIVVAVSVAVAWPWLSWGGRLTMGGSTRLPTGATL